MHVNAKLEGFEEWLGMNLQTSTPQLGGVQVQGSFAKLCNQIYIFYKKF